MHKLTRRHAQIGPWFASQHQFTLKKCSSPLIKPIGQSGLSADLKEVQKCSKTIDQVSAEWCLAFSRFGLHFLQLQTFRSGVVGDFGATGCKWLQYLQFKLHALCFSFGFQSRPWWGKSSVATPLHNRLGTRKCSTKSVQCSHRMEKKV